jgi:hypothetical protein
MLNLGLVNKRLTRFKRNSEDMNLAKKIDMKINTIDHSVLNKKKCNHYGSVENDIESNTYFIQKSNIDLKDNNRGNNVILKENQTKFVIKKKNKLICQNLK